MLLFKHHYMIISHITFPLTRCMLSPHADLDLPLVDNFCKYHLLSLYIVQDERRQNNKVEKSTVDDDVVCSNICNEEMEYFLVFYSNVQSWSFLQELLSCIWI